MFTINELKDRFNYNLLISKEKPFFAEDYVFRKEDYESLQDFDIMHQETLFIIRKIISVQDIFLYQKDGGEDQINIRFHYCWNGYKDAIESLFYYTSNYQKRVGIMVMEEIKSRSSIGDTGIFWRWSSSGNLNVFVFVRNNIFVALTTSSNFDLIKLGSEIDKKLKSLATTEENKELSSHLFDEFMENKEPIQLKLRDRFDLGEISSKFKKSYFVTTSGSVNFDKKLNSWYYRAGNQIGMHEIIHFGLKDGIVLFSDILNVNINENGGIDE